MPVREALGPVAVALILFFSLALPLSTLAAKTRAAPGLDSGYVSALAAADRFLQAWHSGDVEGGMVLLSRHAKEKATTDVIEKFFSNSGPSAYEIGRGKLLRRGHYEFPDVLVSVSKNHARRSFPAL